MSYATRAQVVQQIGRLSKTVTVSSVPSLTDIDQFVIDRSNQIDRVLASRGLAVPMVAPAWFVTDLARLNAEGAAADTMLAAYITNDTNDRGNGAVKLKSFEATLAAFARGEGIPTGIAVAEADLAPRSYFTDAGAIGGSSGGSSGTPGWEWNDDPSGTYGTGTDQFGQRVSAAPIFSIGRKF